MSHPLDFYVKRSHDLQSANRAEVVNKIVKASRRPLPPIIEANRARHKETGKLYSIFGMPFDFKADDYEIVTIGYVFSDPRSNTTYGTVTPTAEGLAANYNENQDKIGEEFRELLEEMADENLTAQVEYWLGKKGA